MISGPTVAATSTLVVAENRGKRRQKLVLCNNSDEDIYLAPGPLAVTAQGIPVVSDGGAWVDEPDTQGWIYQGPWFAICASGGKVLSVTELNRE